MKIDKIKTGYLEENCYVISKNDTCLVIDPGDDYYRIKEEIGTKNVLAVLITHYHFDHIGALNELLKEYTCEVIDYKSKKSQSIGSFNFEIVDTKGHKEDAVTYYFKEEKIMFTGDFLFKDTIGRCDLEGGNIKEMLNSLIKIKEYDDSIAIYPGHGDNTTLNYEIKNNPYMKGDFNE